MTHSIPRRAIIHKAGVVDQEYIDNADDKSVKLNQSIRVRSQEIKRLLPLVKQSSINLIEGIEAIS
jgi:hypothetical protein